MVARLRGAKPFAHWEDGPNGLDTSTQVRRRTDTQTNEQTRKLTSKHDPRRATTQTRTHYHTSTQTNQSNEQASKQTITYTKHQHRRTRSLSPPSTWDPGNVCLAGAPWHCSGATLRPLARPRSLAERRSPRSLNEAIQNGNVVISGLYPVV